MTKKITKHYKTEYENDPVRLLLKNNDSVFHYCKLNVGLENILYDGIFKLFPLGETNDPWEYKEKNFGFIGSYTPDNNDAEESKKMNSKKKDLNDFMRIHARFSSFCCNPISIPNQPINDHLYSFTKSRMWSQYGENHRGLCLSFSRRKLENYIISKYSEKRYIIGNINYKIKNDYKKFIIDLDKNEDMLDYLHKNKDHLLLRKNSDYISEDEYRIIVFSSKPVELPTSEIINAIIIGDRFPKIYIDLIKNIAENKYSIPCRKLIWSNGMPYLTNS